MSELKGIYLVVDPAMGRDELLTKLSESLSAGIDVLQIWNNWPEKISHAEKLALIQDIIASAEACNVPVLINEDWQLLSETNLHGVHFDDIPGNWEEVKSSIDKEKIIGITAGNSLESIRWAADQPINYLSFCAMFPSSSVSSCEIVSRETVLEARHITDLPLFLSGGIRPENLSSLTGLDFQGIAVISGIMSAESPAGMIEEYRAQMRKMNMEL